MPHYSALQVFWQEFGKLTPAEQRLFKNAVSRYVVKPLKNGQLPPSHIFQKMSGYNLYEFRFDRSGRLRATCEMFTNQYGETEVQWRRIGDHNIYQNP